MKTLINSFNTRLTTYLSAIVLQNRGLIHHFRGLQRKVGFDFIKSAEFLCKTYVLIYTNSKSSELHLVLTCLIVLNHKFYSTITVSFVSFYCLFLFFRYFF